MKKHHLTKFAASLAIVMIFTGGIFLTEAKDTYQPVIDPANFLSIVNHPYYPLVPGTVMIFSEKDGDETRERIVTVTHHTKIVMGVKCVVVHDVVALKGEVQEDTYDWFAQDKQGTVWYFGEATREFLGGDRVSAEGSWEAGVNGQPGVIMPGRVVPGPPYRQEYSPNQAEDMGQVVALSDSVTVPYGSFKECLRTKEWSMLESGTEKKWYAKGVGLIRVESPAGEVMVLVSVKHR
jgi:hypothetical protein